jgi:4-aminobutyrate---pyruvate transaminase
VGEARGIGLVAGLELVKDKKSRENFAPADGVAQHVAQRALAHGVITRGLGDVVNLCPPLIITESEIDELLARIGRALDDTHAWAAQKRLVEA